MAESAPKGVMAGLADSVVRRRSVLLAGAVLAGLAWAGSQAWQVARGPLRSDARYQITPELVEITRQPPWAPPDIRRQALARAAMQGPLSILEPEQTNPRLAEAFRLEPWVKQVNRVELTPAGRVRVELEWRRPFAAAELSSGGVARLLLLDAEAVRLPTGGLSAAQLRRLPRIKPIYSAPPEGEAWSDRQVLGAVSLVSRLGEDWRRLSLADVSPSARPEIRGEKQFYRFELTTIGGTQIIWGAAPQIDAPDEATFDQKLARLKQFVAINRVELDTHRSPRSIDLRYGLEPKRRIAKKEEENRTAQKETNSDESADLVK